MKVSDIQLPERVLELLRETDVKKEILNMAEIGAALGLSSNKIRPVVESLTLQGKVMFIRWHTYRLVFLPEQEKEVMEMGVTK